MEGMFIGRRYFFFFYNFKLYFKIGYNDYAPQNKRITLEQFYLINSAEDKNTISHLFPPLSHKFYEKDELMRQKMFKDSHCSALIRLKS